MQGEADLQSTIQQQNGDIASLREQCSNHAKERAALKTILDAKIKALVDDIGQSVSDLPPEVELPMRYHMACINVAKCVPVSTSCRKASLENEDIHIDLYDMTSAQPYSTH